MWQEVLFRVGSKQHTFRPRPGASQHIVVAADIVSSGRSLLKFLFRLLASDAPFYMGGGVTVGAPCASIRILLIAIRFVSSTVMVMSESSPYEVFDLSNPEALSDEDLRRALLCLSGEETRRAVERADPPSLVEEGFTRGFLSNGLPKSPWLKSGILICPGAKIDRSVMNHRCAFVRIGSVWVWEYPDIVEDVVRYLPGPQQRMQSVSLIPVLPGTAIDLIESRTRSGVHALVRVHSFSVVDDELVLVSQRTVSKISHTR